MSVSFERMLSSPLPPAQIKSFSSKPRRSTIHRRANTAHQLLKSSPRIVRTAVEVVDRKKIEMAAAYVDDAWQKEKDDYFKRPRLQRIHSNFRIFFHFLMFAFLLITFFERPSWCYTKTCGDPKYVLHFGLPVFPIFLSQAIEISCLILFILDEILKYCAIGKISYFSERNHFFYNFILTIATIDVLWTLNDPEGIIPGPFRLATALRPIIFILKYKSLRFIFVDVTRMFYDLIPILLLVAITLFWFVVLGLALFEDLSSGDEGEKFFPDFGTSILNLFILLTTSNFPDIMIPAYTSRREYFIYFIAYLVIVYYFLMNLVLATVINSYQELSEQTEEGKHQNEKDSLRKAYSILDPQNIGKLSLDSCRLLIIELNNYREIPFLKPREIDEIMYSLDHDKTKRINEWEFMHLCTILKDHHTALQLEKSKSLLLFKNVDFCTKKLSEAFPRQFRIAGKVVRHRSFEYFWGFIICFNFFFITLELMQENTWVSQDISSIVEFIFTVMYVFEMSFKILVLGWNKYFIEDRHKFDFFVTIISFAAELYVIIPNNFNDASVIQYIVLFRLVRVLRVFTYWNKFHNIFKTFFKIMPACATLSAGLFAFCYIYVQIGVSIFGGQIYKNNPLLKGSDFEEANYFSLNFNDLGSGLILLFTLLVVNNWTVIMDGFYRTSETGWSRLYFIFFYIVGVLVALNLVVAFILDEHDRQGNERTSSKDDEDSMCQDCEESIATFHCKECNEFLCDACDSSLHFTKKRRSHNRIKLEKEYDQTQVTPNECQECDDYDAVIYCEECRQYLCGVCNASLHATKKSKKHTRKEVMKPSSAPEKKKFLNN